MKKQSMKRQLTMFGMVMALGVNGAVFAQADATRKGQMDKGMMMDGSMTMTGCVAAGKQSGQFMLTNAMMMGGMDKGKMAKDNMQPSMSGHMMSYELVGGDNMKAHMGHKVEVVGTMSKADMDRMHKMGSMDKMDQGKMAGMSDKDMTAMKLNVKSFKMMSANCP